MCIIVLAISKNVKPSKLELINYDTLTQNISFRKAACVQKKIHIPCHLIAFLKIYTVGKALAIFVVLDISTSRQGILLGIPISKHLYKGRITLLYNVS